MNVYWVPPEGLINIMPGKKHVLFECKKIITKIKPPPAGKLNHQDELHLSGIGI